MPKTQLRDIVVILPGIGGSVLQQDGRDIWNYSSQSILPLVQTRGHSLDPLKLPRDVSNAEDFDDGIRATSLVRGAHIIPRLEKVLMGYYHTSQHIKDNLDNVIEGNIFDNKPANFYEFPYDWRIDNRINAQRLKTFLDRQLPIWREHGAGSKDAKVILLAHSMGGLISRYYLEVLEGWVDCQALFTFGTPYRGSINAIDFLANSQKLLKVIEVTDIVRSFPSVYQLLPRQPVLKIGNSYQSIAEATIPLPNINPNMALDAKKFHDEIEAAVNRHRKDPEYWEFFQIIPIVGIKQTTNQSAQLADGKITISATELPQGIDPRYGDGDGIVPYWSAIPQELSRKHPEILIAEQHGAIQSNHKVLEQVCDKIRGMQDGSLENFQGSEVLPDDQMAGISLSVDDLYQSGEAITIRAQLKDTQRDFGGIEAEIRSLSDDESSPQLLQLNQTGDLWSVETGDLKRGVYQVTVETVKSPEGAPTPVRDVFEVI